MRCTTCQRDNPPDAAFCSGCGRRVALLCPSCARTNAPDSGFCNGCGHALQVAVNRRSTLTPFRRPIVAPAGGVNLQC